MHGANVQPGQVLMITGEIGNEDVARAVAAAGYRRGAKFVDVDYFDPHVKRARIEYAEPDTLDFVPSWYGTRMLDRAHGLVSKLGERPVVECWERGARAVARKR